MGGKATTITTAIRLKKKGLNDLSKVDNLELLSLFTRLMTIELHHNKLTGFPDTILEDLRKSPRVIEYLQELNLSHNRFTTLPQELYLLINLKILRLNHNKITEISPRLFSFYRLEELNIEHNNIENLPWNFSKLRKLKRLYLQSNKIKFIPNTIGKLGSTLEEIILIPNPLTPMPEEEFIWACHNGYTDIIIEYLAKQTVPQEYPFYSEIKRNEEKKKKN